MSYATDVIQMISTAFMDAWFRIFAQLPFVIIGVSTAVLLIIIGWIIGKFAKIIVSKALKAFKLDEWAKEHSLKEAVGGIELSTLTGSFVKWYIIIVFVAQATVFVQLQSIRTFMNALVFYAPNVFISLVLLTMGLLFARFVRNKINDTNFKVKKQLAAVTEALVVFVVLLIALRKAGVNVAVLENAFLIFFGALVVVLAVVFGLSVGFAFKEDIKSLVEDVRRNLR